jgi:LysM repeat protein
MTNPFTKGTANIADQQQTRREQFRVSVYAALGGLTLLLVGALIQGCHAQKPGADAEVGSGDAATNTAGTTTNASADPSLLQETNDLVQASNTPTITALAPDPQPTNSYAFTARTNSTETLQPSSGGTTRYTIKRGDNLLRIAKAHYTPVQALKEANGLTSDRIVAGKELKLPPPSSSISAARGS